MASLRSTSSRAKRQKDLATGTRPFAPHDLSDVGGTCTRELPMPINEYSLPSDKMSIQSFAIVADVRNHFAKDPAYIF
jgi:hypothetical protein